MRAKQLHRALNDMSEEGVVQVFRPLFGSWPIVGAVGSLQHDVLVSRLKQEYGVSVRLEPTPYETARWIVSDKPDRLQDFCEAHHSRMVKDKDSAL